MKTSEEPVVVEQIFSTSVKNLWNALTDLTRMKKWYFENIESFKPEVGFETSFIVRVEDRSFTHQWRVTEVVPNKKIKYNWKYKEYPGDSFVTFEIIEEDNWATLKLTTEVIEDFPDEIPEFRRESCLQGWDYFIKDRLKDYLEKVDG